MAIALDWVPMDVRRVASRLNDFAVKMPRCMTQYR